MNIKFESLYDLHDYYSRQLHRFTLKLYFKKIRAKFHRDIDAYFMYLFIDIYEHQNELVVEPSQIKEYGIIINKKITPSEFKLYLAYNTKYYDTYILLEQIYQDYQEYNNLLKKRQEFFYSGF